MKKKVLSLLVTFAMVLGMFPATALAADFNVTADGNDLNDAESNDYYTFDEVLTYATAEDTIIIKEDITADTAFTVTDTTIDLGGNTLKIGAGGNYFKGDVTVKNGTIDISGVTANGDCIMGIGDRSADATLTLSDVDLIGTDYSSAFAVLMVYGNGTLNVTGGEWTLTGEKGSAGGVIKNENGAGDSGSVNITGTTMMFDDVTRGIAGATVVLDDVDLTITGGDNGINGSKLTVKNGSEITITGGTGRALTVTDYDVTVENSTLNFSGNEEADIRFKSSNTLTIDTNSTLSDCSVIADSAATAAKVNDTIVTGTETAPQSVSVADGETTIKTAPKGNVPTGYTTETKIWGETWSNAQESYVIKIYSGDTLMGTTTLNPDVYTAFDGDVSVTWHISFDPSTDTDEYWIQEWTVAPSLIMQPDKVVLCVDGVDVSEGEIQMNGPDNINKIVAATADSTGSITGYYTTLADALSAAADGGTVQLLSGSTAISAAGAVYGKTVTITGEAVFDWSKGNLFVGRGGEGDGKLIFKNAVITSSSNNSSTGIHVSGREKGTNNKYDGTLVIDNSTIELDYLINRGTIEVIGNGTVGETPNLEVKNGFGIAGRPASETESGEPATATITIKNGAYVKVLNHNGMGVGTASTTPEGYGVLNLEDSKFECDSFNVTKDLGTFNVSGESVVAIDALSGGGVMYLNGVELDENTVITGTEAGVIKVASGTNNISGSTIKVKTFQVGTGKEDSNVAPTENVVVNLMDGAVLSTKGSDYDGWVGSKYGNTISDVRYILNIDESVATFGYLHVSKDGVLNVKGDVAEEDKANIASGNYTFYVGNFIVNGVATLDDVDTRVQYGKVSVDNTDTGESAGTLNIKNCDEIVFAAEGNTNSALKWWNSGVVNIENSTVSARTPNITATGALNLVGSEFSTSSTAITNAGTITMDAASKITATDIAGDGEVAIDATGFTGTKTVIDVDSTTTLTNNKLTVTGSDYKRSSGDVILVNVGDVESGTLYVNTDWTSQDAIDAVMGEFSGYEYNTNVFDTLSAAFSAAGNGNTVEIMSAGTYELSTSGKDITITGSVDGVVFDNIGAKNMGGANVTFNNVTFDYYPNKTYTGLQHSGNLTYNNCIINGQVFLYGASETFNNCTFNQNSADAYNVWTYGAKAVAFNECTFNSVGKSVLVYNEGACATDLTVTDTEFAASAPADGKAAIEIDTSLMPDGTDIVVDAATTASGFGTGSVSGNSLWNDKKDQTDLTVTVGEEQVWPIAVAQIGDQKFYSLQDALTAAEAGDTVTIFAGEYDGDVSVNKAITVVGETDAEGNNLVTINGKLSVTGTGVTVKNLNVDNSIERAVYVSGGNILIEGCNLSGVHGLRYCYANNGDVTLKNCVITGSTYGVHFDGGSGDGDVIIDGCTITGWTSFGTAIEEVTITDTTFVDGNYNLLRFYQDATLTNVTIPSGNYGDYAGSGMRIDTGNSGAGMEGITVTATGCKTADGSDFTGAFPAGVIVATDVTVDGELLGAVAKIGETSYKTLAGAVAAAQTGDTITLLTDTSEAERISIGSEKEITIVGQENGEGEDPAFTGWFKVTGKLTLKDVTLVAPSTAVPGESTSQYTKTVIGLMNTGDVVCENVTFDMSNAVPDSTAITAWWSTGDGANITVTDCTFDCAGQRPIRSDACVTVEGCTFNDPYRYAVQMTSKSSTMAEDAEAYVVFNNNTIVDGEYGKEYVYGVQLEGGYGCSDLTITGTGNTITADANDGSTLYFVENTDKMDFETIQWKTEAAPVLEESTFAAKIAGTDGDIYLPTLAEAIEIVAADGTVTLVANSTEEITVSKALTIELNGFTAEKVAPADGYAVVKYETKWVFGSAGFVVPVTGVTLSGTTSVKVGNTTTLTATVAPDNATNKNVTWTSSDTSVATVADGVVTGVAAGTATITVTTEDGGFAADCTVTVSRASSGGGGGGGSASYTIAVEDTKNGDITVSPSRASSGSTVTITVDPDSGYELDELTVLDRNGKEIKLTKKSDSKYTFKMPSGKVTIEAIFAEIEAFENPFVDVAEGAYYYDAVLWAAENGITGGTSATTFSPAVTCTRAQTVTFLWRAAGSPDPEGTNRPFSDVVEGAYYYDAVLWAVENGITSGTSATTFSPNATVTRAQNVTFLWRWAESPAAEQANPFVDVAEGKYYHDAVIWAAEQGITAGTTATTFSPDDPCLRSQIVTFLYRYLAK